MPGDSSKCPKCGSAEIVVESMSAKTKKIKCSKCGLSEVRDLQERKLLTEQLPAGHGPTLRG